MSAPVFLYPSLTDEMKQKVFQAREYCFSYTSSDGTDKNLAYESAALDTSINCLKTDGIWSADKYNLIVRRSIAVKNFGILFGPKGLACRNARLGLSMVWTSPCSRQRGATPIFDFGIGDGCLPNTNDHSFVGGEAEFEFPIARIRDKVNFTVVLYIHSAGTPGEDEIHLANEEGFVLGSFDTFSLSIDGTGSLFPVYEVFERGRPLWSVRCDWTDPTQDLFSETVSISINTAHKSYKYLDRAQKTFCSQLLVEVMSSALCCIIEKLRMEHYLDQILGDDEMELGSIGAVVRYFANTLDWEMSSPDELALSTRRFFDERLAD